MNDLPIGIQDFAELRTGGYVYVDKTEHVHRLLDGKYYFISRPRRFGKSLLVSTLRCLFEGKRELFSGLWIEDKIAWERHPVLHFDLSTVPSGTEEELKRSVCAMLDRHAERHGLRLERKTIKEKHLELIERLHERSGSKVVVLVDEYDKPMIDHVEDARRAATNREVLRQLYEPLKPADPHLRFVLLTGVTRFSKVSVFSALNNLNDVTFTEAFNSMLGYTEEEIRRDFPEHVAALRTKLGLSDADLWGQLRRWYDGYSWTGKGSVYNPFSTLKLLSDREFGTYWFASGTPTFLVRTLGEKRTDPSELQGYQLDAAVNESFDLEAIHPVVLLLQTGYLTVKEVRKGPRRRVYVLDYPNLEVKDSLLKVLLLDRYDVSDDALVTISDSISEAIDTGDVDALMRNLQSFLASIPHNVISKMDREAYYEVAMYILLSLCGERVEIERPVSSGVIDMVVEGKGRVLVIELKSGAGAEDKALAQVRGRGYHERFLGAGRDVLLVGAAIDHVKRNISGWKVEMAGAAAPSAQRA